MSLKFWGGGEGRGGGEVSPQSPPVDYNIRQEVVAILAVAAYVMQQAPALAYYC